MLPVNMDGRADAPTTDLDGPGVGDVSTGGAPDVARAVDELVAGPLVHPLGSSVPPLRTVLKAGDFPLPAGDERGWGLVCRDTHGASDASAT